MITNMAYGHTKNSKQANKQTYRHTTDIHTYRQSDRHAHICTYIHTNILAQTHIDAHIKTDI